VTINSATINAAMIGHTCCNARAAFRERTWGMR
jgi:hypothetical protein